MIFHLALGKPSKLSSKKAHCKLFMRFSQLRFLLYPQSFIKMEQNILKGIVFSSQRLFYNFPLRLPNSFLKHIEHNRNGFKQW